MKLTVLDSANPQQPFPPLRNALREPNGLLAVGGCLSSERLVNAYRHGVFHGLVATNLSYGGRPIHVWCYFLKN